MPSTEGVPGDEEGLDEVDSAFGNRWRLDGRRGGRSRCRRAGERRWRRHRTVPVRRELAAAGTYRRMDLGFDTCRVGRVGRSRARLHARGEAGDARSARTRRHQRAGARPPGRCPRPGRPAEPVRRACADDLRSPRQADRFLGPAQESLNGRRGPSHSDQSLRSREARVAGRAPQPPDPEIHQRWIEARHAVGRKGRSRQ